MEPLTAVTVIQRLLKLDELRFNVLFRINTKIVFDCCKDAVLYIDRVRLNHQTLKTL